MLFGNQLTLDNSPYFYFLPSGSKNHPPSKKEKLEKVPNQFQGWANSEPYTPVAYNLHDQVKFFELSKH